MCVQEVTCMKPVPFLFQNNINCSNGYYIWGFHGRECSDVVFSIVLLCNCVGMCQYIGGIYFLCKCENRGNIFLRNLDVHVQNCMVTQQNTMIEFFCVYHMPKVFTRKTSLHFICSCHLDLGILKVKKGHTEVSLVCSSFHLGTYIFKVYFHNWNAL